MNQDFGPIGKMVCYKSNQFLAFNKPTGLPVQHKDQVDLYSMACAYAKRSLHLIHRIDQPVSGVVLLARNSSAAKDLSIQFARGKVDKVYYAITENKPPVEEGDLEQYLVKNSLKNKSFISDKAAKDAKKVSLSYSFVASSDNYHLLKIRTHTGRHHQIRAQLAAMGCPIKGDVKYGARRKNADRSIHLHAASLDLIHPTTQEKEHIVAPPPDEVLWNFFQSNINT